PVFGSVRPAETAPVSFVDFDELPIDAVSAGNIEDPDPVTQKYRRDKHLKFIDEIVVESLPGNIGADDLNVLLTGDFLGTGDGFKNGAIQGDNGWVARKFFWTVGEDEFGAGPRAAICFRGHGVTYVALGYGCVVTFATGNNDGHFRSHIFGGAVGIGFGGFHPRHVVAGSGDEPVDRRGKAPRNFTHDDTLRSQRVISICNHFS